METDAKLVVRESQLETMLDESSVGYHDELYLNVAGDEVRLLAGNPASASGTYCDYDGGWFEEVDGSSEAYVSVSELEDYLELVSDGMADRFVLLFESAGDEGRLSDRLRIVPEEGDHFEVTLMLPSGRHVMDAVPTGLPGLFDDDDKLIGADQNDTLACTVETYISELSKITQAVDLREGKDYYPIVVDNGELKLDIGSDRDQHVSARLNGEVSGPDVDCLYQGHFAEIVSVLSGDVILNLEQDSTMAIVFSKKDRTIRHVIGAAA